MTIEASTMQQTETDFDRDIDPDRTEAEIMHGFRVNLTAYAAMLIASSARDLPRNLRATREYEVFRSRFIALSKYDLPDDDEMPNEEEHSDMLRRALAAFKALQEINLKLNGKGVDLITLSPPLGDADSMLGRE